MADSKPDMKKSRAVAQVPERYLVLLDEMANDDDTSRARHMRFAIKEYLERNGKLGALIDREGRATA